LSEAEGDRSLAQSPPEANPALRDLFVSSSNGVTLRLPTVEPVFRYADFLVGLSGEGGVLEQQLFGFGDGIVQAGAKEIGSPHRSPGRHGGFKLERYVGAGIEPGSKDFTCSEW
jgi:hypothetical protein